MTTFLTLITHILIMLAAILFAYIILRIILAADTQFEKAARTVALSVALLSYFGSKALGLDLPSFLLRSIGVLKPILTAFIGGLIPSLAGYFSARLLLKSLMSKHEEIRLRLIVLISTYLLLLFSDVYVAAFGHKVESSLNQFLLPNLSFAVGLGLYLIFHVRETAELGGVSVGNWRKWR